MLDFQNISICRKGEKVLDHFNLKAPDGVILALLGEDKEAKSMLLKTASGGEKPVSYTHLHFANRKELKEKIESLGGKVTGSVSKKTDYLINNDTMSSSSKNKKAKELGIPVITEKEFLSMVDNNQ